MSVCIVYGYTKANPTITTSKTHVLKLFCAWKHQKEIILDIYIYTEGQREVLSANSENMKQYFNIGSRTCLRAFSSFRAKAVHWKALQSKKKKKRTQNNA